MRRKNSNTLLTRKFASAGVFEIQMESLGQVNGGNFSVLVRPIDLLARGDYIGLAYRVVDPTTISVTRNGNQTQITWTGVGTLQAADDVAGPYINVAPAATSPYTS